MNNQFLYDNNVKVTLAQDLTDSANEIKVNAATGIYRNPPNASSSPGGAIVTLTDTNSTKIEIVNYREAVDNGDGTITLKTVARGQQRTTAQAFSAGDYLFQTLTADDINYSEAISFNYDNHVIFAGREDGGPIWGFQGGFYKDLFGRTLLGFRRTGWSAATGTASRSAFATYTAPTVGATYNATVQSQLNAALAHIQVLSQHIKALEDDLIGHGIIGT